MQSGKVHKIFRKALSFTIALMLLAGTVVHAETPAATTTPATTAAATTTAASGSFPDVPAAHWANKHVAKLALLGIMQGYPTGKFMPNAAVTQQEAIVMAIRALGYENQIDKSDTAYVMPMDVGAFYKPYVILALKKGLINLQDETASLKPNDNTWGTREATREWVAVLTIKAIGKEQEAAGLTGSVYEFHDQKDISTKALPFVNEAVKLNIVTGLTNGTFVPKGSVTRAEIAAFFSRALDYSAQSAGKFVKGLLVSKTDSQVGVMNDNGQVSTYGLSASALYYSKASAPITAADVKPPVQVTMISDQNNVKYIELTSDPIQVEVTQAVYASSNASDRTITVLVNGAQTVYPLASDVKVTDPQGAPSSLAALVKDSQIELRRYMTGSTAKVTDIQIKVIPINKTFEGTLQAADSQARTVTVVNKDTNAAETFPLADQPTLVSGDKPLASLADLNAGDIVKVEVKSSKIASVTVTKPIYTFQQGVVDEISAEKHKLYIKLADKSLVGYIVDDQAKVTISGTDSALLADVAVGDSVSLQLHSGTGKVIKITVNNRSVESYSRLRLVHFDSKSKTVLLENNGDQSVYYITANTVITNDGTPVTLDAFSSVFQPDYKVNVKVSGKNLLSIQLANKYEGTITGINLSTNAITLKIENDQTVTIPLLGSPLIDILNKTSSTIRDLKTGDTVKVMMTSTQDKGMSVYVKTPVLYTLTDKSTLGYNKITVKDDQGYFFTYAIGNTIDLYNANQDHGTFSDFVVGDPVIATFYGNQLYRVDMVKVYKARVTSIAGSKVALKDYNGQAQQLDLSGDFKIVNGTTTSTTIAALKVNDRVQVSKDALGRPIVTIIPGISKIFWNYDSTRNEVNFRRANISEKYTYSVQSNAFIHSGEQVISLTSLQDGDAVTIYLSDDKIIDLEK